jgi:tripartite-type tricarboxylate transporter receptor subunit TctC
VHVPYTGTAPALNALLSGAVDVTFSDVITAAPQIEAGNVRVLAVSGRHRVKSMPNVPTIEEAGLPGFVVVGWAGLVAKAGTPSDRIKLINEQVNRALVAPDVAARVAELGGEIVGGTPEAFGKFMQEEDKKWGDLARSANLRIADK